MYKVIIELGAHWSKDVQIQMICDFQKCLGENYFRGKEPFNCTELQQRNPQAVVELGIPAL